MVYDWMLHLPIWLQALVVIGVAGVVSLAVTGTLRTITALHYGESHNEVIGFVFATCGVIYAVLLAFVVFAVYTQFASADKVVTSEAATLASLYLDTERYPEPVRSAIQEAIRGYTRSVVNDEFPAMQRGQPSSTTRARLTQLYRLNARLQAGDAYSVQLDNKASQEIESIALLREERIQASKASLPKTFWFVLILGGLITVTLGASLFMRQAFYQLLSSALLGIMIASVLFLVMTLDRPFTGTTAISPGAFERSLELYSKIDELNRPQRGLAAPASLAAPRSDYSAASPAAARADARSRARETDRRRTRSRI